MNEPLKWKPGWPFLLGVLATVVLTVLAAVLTTTAASLSILIALLGLTLTLVLDLISRVERRQEMTSRALRVADAIEQIPETREDLEHALLLAGQIEQRGGARFREALKRVTGGFRDDLEGLSKGNLRVQTGSGALLSEETDQARERIRATSVVSVDEAWWGSDAAKAYAKTNEAALERGVSITRIFICDGEKSERLTKLMGEQRDLGTEVYGISQAEVPEELQINVVIFDKKAVYEITETKDPKSPLRMLRTQPNDVQAAIDKFESLLQLIMQR